MIRSRNLILSLVGIAAVMLVIGVVIGSIAFPATKTETETQLSAVAIAHTGLLLEVGLNSTSLRVGQSLNITISLVNNLILPSSISTVNNFSSFKVLGFPIAMWSPCMFQEPVEFMLVKGNYSLSDLELLSLAMNGSSLPQIVCMESGSVSQIVLQPMSDVGDILGNFCITSCQPRNFSEALESNFTVSGYWGYPFNTSEAGDILTPVDGGAGITYQYPEVSPVTQAPFTSGEYTLVVSDEWGQTVVLHFSVA